MERFVRRRWEAGVRVRDFSRVHPSTDASYALVVDQLTGAIVRIEGLSKQQQEGFVASRAATVRRLMARRRLHNELLRHLVTVAELASTERPDVAVRIRMARGNEPNAVFGTHARKMLEEGQAEKELLAKHGLADKLLDDLAAAVADFDASVQETNEGRREHVGARAELKAVSDEIMRLVDVLDGLNRYRFAGNAELLAAWESARNVVSGPRPAEPETPAQGNERPAA